MLYSDPKAYPLVKYGKNKKIETGSSRNYARMRQNDDRLKFNLYPESYESVFQTANNIHFPQIKEKESDTSKEQSSKMDLKNVMPLVQSIIGSNSEFEPLVKAFSGEKFDIKNVIELISKNPKILTSLLNLFSGKNANKTKKEESNIDNKESDSELVGLGAFDDYEIVD